MKIGRWVHNLETVFTCYPGTSGTRRIPDSGMLEIGRFPSMSEYSDGMNLHACVHPIVCAGRADFPFVRNNVAALHCSFVLARHFSLSLSLSRSLARSFTCARDAHTHTQLLASRVLQLCYL